MKGRTTMGVEILSLEEYSEYVYNCAQRSFMQTPEMAELLKKRGYTVEFVGLRNGENRLTNAAILYSKPMTGGLHMEINSGPVSSDTRYLRPFYNNLRYHSKRKGALELIIKPYDDYHQLDNDGYQLIDPQEEYIVALTTLDYKFDGLQTGYPGGEPDWHYVKEMSEISQEELLDTFTKNGKATVKKANTFGIKLKKLNRDELHIFKEATAATSDRREYTDKPLDYYQDFYDAFGDKAEFMAATLNFKDYLHNLERDKAKLEQQLTILTDRYSNNPDSAKFHRQTKELNRQIDTFNTRISEAHGFIQKYGDQDQVLAVSLFVYTRQEVTYLFSGSYPEFNKFYAPALLQEYGMREAIRRKIPLYNFLGIMGVFDGSDSVLRFKQNFNGYIVRKTGTFRYYPNPIKYKAIQLIKKILRRS